MRVLDHAAWMKVVPLVQRSEADLARKLEAKLLGLPKSHGILFVGISIVPHVKDERAVYSIWVGCSRNYEESTIKDLVQYALREEIESGLHFVVEAHRGVARSS
jgi:hypothetical protein